MCNMQIRLCIARTHIIVVYSVVDGLIKVGLVPVNCLCCYCDVFDQLLVFLVAKIDKEFVGKTSRCAKHLDLRQTQVIWEEG